jgi:hypothetical protein
LGSSRWCAWKLYRNHFTRVPSSIHATWLTELQCLRF